MYNFDIIYYYSSLNLKIQYLHFILLESLQNLQYRTELTEAIIQ